MPSYKVRNGAAYFAGIDLPFFVSADDVAEAAREQGFSDVIVTDRARARFAFEVRKVPGYSDDWNAAFFGIYRGRQPSITVPQRPSWVFEVQQQIPPPGKTVVPQPVQVVRAGAPPPKPASSGGGLLALAIAGGAAIWIWSSLEPVRIDG